MLFVEMVSITDITTEKNMKKDQRLLITMYILIQTDAKYLDKQLLRINASINREI